MKRNILQSLALMVMVVACSNKTESLSIKDIKVEEAKILIVKKNPIILDVRTPEEYDANHINYAINIDYYNPNFEDSLKKLDLQKPILVYCKVGGRSSKASKILENLGAKLIYNLDGGFDSWLESGMEED